MADLDVGKLSITIEADGRAAIFEIDRVLEAAEGASSDAARAYKDAGRDMADAFKPAAESAEETGEAVRKVGDEAERTGETIESAGQKSTKSLKQTLETAEKFSATMTASVTAPLLALYGAMSKGASDLTETIGKTDVTFAEFADDMYQWSESSIENMGLAQQTALDTASTYGDMATGMGIARAEAAVMGRTLTQLSADMSSFKNISQDRVAQALAAVYTGETEALKSLGIVMTQTNLQAFAMTEGITKQVSELTQAEQVQLRYRYVLAQTANAQGDFARTGGNLANNSRALVQTLKQAGTAFGSILNPAINDGVTLLREAAQNLAQLDDGTKTMILSIGGTVAAAGPLVLVGTKVVKLVTTLKAAVAGLSLGHVALGLTAAAAAFAGIYAALNRAGEEIDTTSEKYQRLKRIISSDDKVNIEVDSSQLDEVDGRKIEVTYDVSQAEGSDQEAWDAFVAKIDSMGWEEKRFSATGSFEMSESTTEELNAYAEALANAATATEDYDAAVESLNALLDEKLQAQLAQINQQVAERAENLVAALNSGAITESEFDTELEKITQDAIMAKEAVIDATEALQDANSVYANGKRSDDAPAMGDAFKTLYADATLETEHMEGAIEVLKNAAVAGEDLTKYQIEAKVVNQQLAEQAIANYETMTAAQQEYDEAIRMSNETIANAEANFDQAGTLQDMIDSYINMARIMPDAESALAEVNTTYTNLAEGMGISVEEMTNLQSMLREILQGDSGLMSGAEVAEAYGGGTFIEAYRQEMLGAIEEAEAAKATAAETFADTLEGLTADFSAAEVQMLMELTASAGAAMSESDAELVAGATAMMESLADAIETGGEEATGKVSEIIASVGSEADEARSEGKEVGAAITAGITAGLNSGAGALYAKVRSIVNLAIETAKKTGEIRSPSRRAAREVGAPIVQGIGMGAEEETPNVVRTMKASVEHLITAGASVVNHGAYTTPVVQSIAGGAIDYGAMGEAMAGAVSQLKLGISIGETELGVAMRETNARQAALRAHQISVGKGRIG